MIKIYHRLKLSQKLIILFVIVSIVPIIGIQTFNYAEFKKNMTRQIDKVVTNNLVQISERIDLSLDTYTNFLYQIYTDDELIKNIIELSAPGSNTMLLKSEIGGSLRRYSEFMKGGRCISIVCPDGTFISYDMHNNSFVNTIWNDVEDMRTVEPYVNAEQSRYGMVITPTRQFGNTKESGYYFHISKKMIDFYHVRSGTVATVILTLDEKLLDGICNQDDTDTDTGINFIVSSDGIVMSYPNESYTSIHVEEEQIEEFVKASGFLSDSHVIINKYEDKKSGWIIYNAYDESYIMADVNRTQKTIIGISAVVLLIVAFIIIKIIYELNLSVQNVMKGMKSVKEGNLDVQISVVNEDEIGVIAKNFNEMTQRVKRLILQVTEAKDRQRKAEIHALEAQINPHFLYNTLDSINWMAIEHGESEISKALCNLGIILRETVNHSDELITIEKTVILLQRYMELQQMRFEGAFTYEVECDEASGKMQIHKLMIQPFVENAIIHGMEQTTSGGHIAVRFVMSENHDYLEISITDNGKGMTDREIAEFNNREYIIKENVGEHGIGLKNALQRMDMYYGDKADWNINSVEGIGTEIVLYIPINRGQEGSV